MAEFGNIILENQKTIKCCSVLPDEDSEKLVEIYEYVPEEIISLEYFNELMSGITLEKEDIDRAHIDCEGGACPIDFKEG